MHHDLRVGPVRGAVRHTINVRRWLLPAITSLIATGAIADENRVSVRVGAAAFGDLSADAPQVRREIRASDLPAPFRTPSAVHTAQFVPKPAGVNARLPPGFDMALFVSGLNMPRVMQVAPNGDVFVAESGAGQVRVMRTVNGATRPSRIETFISGLSQPFGIGFYPPGKSPRYVYIGTVDSVVRVPYREGDLIARGPAETLVHGTWGEGGHWTRNIAFSLDGSKMFVSVGSHSNDGREMPKRDIQSIRHWEQTHVSGASWGAERNRANVLEFDPRGKRGRIFATGIRNCIGLAVQPRTGALWCSTSERDGLGDDLVPDYVTRVRQGQFFGWPWYYIGDHEDPTHLGERPDLRARVTVPDVLIQAHSASMAMVFYDGQQFPAEYQGQLLVAEHGSWNRSKRTGHKIIRVVLRNGEPTGEYEDFITGLVVDEDHVWARPVALAVARDGSLLISEDAMGTIWRVTYRGRSP
jgi:glucose/arabinose dehydrogenase